MKNIFTIFLSWLVCSTAFAQTYNPELEGKLLPAKIIFGDGVVHDIQMAYQQPEYFKNPQNKFKLAKADGSGAYDHTGGIEAYLIDNNVWALRTVKGQQQFVILRQQGIIEQYEYIINGELGEVKGAKTQYVIVGKRSQTVWHNKLKNETVEGNVSVEQLKAWVADVPDVEKDLQEEETAAKQKREQPAEPKKGLMGALEKAAAKENEMKTTDGVDVGRIINNYNVSYESRSPGNVKYYFSPSMMWTNRTKSQEEMKAEKQAKLDDLFAGRSNTVSPEVASAKDNVPVKKETFGAKINRIKADGNKIGVYIKVLPARTVQLQTGTVALNNPVAVDGGYMDESLRQAGQQLADELNKAYNTTDFELIDMSKIPYREIKVVGQQTRIDDWWATKYKLVFIYTLDPRLEPASTGGQFTATLNLLQSLMVVEFIGGPGATKQDILAQILNMGGFRTPAYAQDDELKDPQEIYEKTLTKLTMPILEKIKTERADGLAKVVKRLAP